MPNGVPETTGLAFILINLQYNNGRPDGLAFAYQKAAEQLIYTGYQLSFLICSRAAVSCVCPSRLICSL